MPIFKNDGEKRVLSGGDICGGPRPQKRASDCFEKKVTGYFFAYPRNLAQWQSSWQIGKLADFQITQPMETFYFSICDRTRETGTRSIKKKTFPTFRPSRPRSIRIDLSFITTRTSWPGHRLSNRKRKHITNFCTYRFHAGAAEPQSISPGRTRYSLAIFRRAVRAI